MASLLLIKSMLLASALQKTSKKKKRNKKKTSISVKGTNKDMCRICNVEKGEIPILNNIIQPNIPEEIKHFSGVTICSSDKFSKHMCQNCLDLLNGCIMFREMCQRNNNKFLKMKIKKEYCDDYNDDNGNPVESEDSYNIPSPTFSEDNSKLWGCTTCNNVFYDLETYNNHLPDCKPLKEAPKPPGEVTKKKFLCDTCGKTFISHAGLLAHMVIHENIFPYKCEVCPYQGRTMDLLKVHKRSHMTEKPFKCTQCPKATTTSSNLRKHMRHVHSTSRPYKCTYCDKGFTYHHDMKRHIKDIHLRQGTVECDVCLKKFNTKKILQGHRLKIHKIKGERHGRLPSYLQCQMEGHNTHNTINNENESYNLIY